MQKVQLRWKALGFIVTSGAGGTNGKRETEIRDLNSLGVRSAKDLPQIFCLKIQ